MAGYHERTETEWPPRLGGGVLLEGHRRVRRELSSSVPTFSKPLLLPNLVLFLFML